MLRFLPVVALAAFAACNASNPEPRLTSVEPATVSSLAATRAILHGTNLDATAKVALDNDRPAELERGWGARIDGVVMDEAAVTWRTPTEIDLVIPRGLSRGVHDVIATAPDGREVVLPHSLTVVDEAVGLTLSIETAPGGTGAPIVGSFAAGDRIEAYAVIRDAGAFVIDIDVVWQAQLGTLTPSSANHTTFTATTPGTTQITAHRAAAGLSASTGDLEIVAGPASQVVIVDAAGGSGVRIADRSGLTTDSDGGLNAYAVSLDAFGNFVADVPATWSLTGVAGVVPSGQTSMSAVDFTTPGTGILHALASAGTAQTGNLTVASGRAAQLTIAPASLSITTDAAPVTFTASATDGDGNATTNLGTLGWSINSGPITAIDATTGSFDPHVSGSGTIGVTSSLGLTAVSGSIVVAPGRASAIAIAPPSLTISADAPPRQMSVTGTDAEGNATTDLGTVSWSIASGSISSLSTTGAFDPHTAGTGTIAATSSFGAASSAPVTVIPGQAANLVVSPDTVDVVQGTNPVAFSVAATDADGNSTPDLGTIAWSISAGPITVLDSTTGVLTPTAPGIGTIRATSSYGPLDNTGSIRIRKLAGLSTVFTTPAIVSVGQSFTVSMTITNTGEANASNVSPCTPTTSGAGAVTIGSGPTPGPQTVAPSATAVFSWNVTAQSAGPVQLVACATGTDTATNQPITAAAVTSSTITVQSAAALTASLTTPSLLGRGNHFTVTMIVTNTGQATATGVTPGTLTRAGTGNATIFGSPPGGVSIAGGGAATFAWTYTATVVGTLRLTGLATGTDANKGSTVTSNVAQSALANIVEAMTVAGDPFGDGSKFAFVTGYASEVYLGPSDGGTAAARFAPDGSNLESLGFRLPADVVGNRTSNTSTAPYPSIGATGCTANTATCGPDNENGRGIFTSVTVTGTEWLVAAGARTVGNVGYVYMTPDTDTTLDFRYVDLTTIANAGVIGVSAIGAVNNILYIGMTSNAGTRPVLAALKAMPSSGPGIDPGVTDLVNMKADHWPALSNSTVDRIDAIFGSGSLLYLANAAAWVRATVANPGNMEQSAADWLTITPSSSSYTAKISRTTTKGANLTPADRGVTQFASFGGRVFIGRNTTTGPQLWSCLPSRTGDPAQCDAGDWALVAPNSSSCFLVFCNGDTKLSQFDDSRLSTISMVVATPQFLYIGFDSTSGVTVFRTANPAASSQADFEGLAGCSAAQHGSGNCVGYGGAGLGDSSDTAILDAKALTFGAVTTVWVTVGNATAPLALVTIP